ncbi:glycosyltransferase [Plantactinospora sp. CA-290183]|uniref:glycosyltransferase n=1 Tax=Plantactinospora sp. CA-290183 TaxID=3240006 RepID=UPI003D93C38C
MTGLRPSDPEVLATAVADSLVVAVDPDAPRSCLFYWENARPWLTAVVDGVRKSRDDEIRSIGERLLENPADPAHHRSLRQALVARGNDDPATAELFEAAWQAECNNRLGYHLGPRYADDGADPVTPDELKALAPSTRPAAGADAEILVVIPFRDRDTREARLRNLLACLHTLHDQSYARERYRVVVVETDDRPRFSEVIRPHVDDYIFAPKADTFNKSWAVNVGVVNAARAAEVICILDADVLTDRDFIARNAARFQRPGTAGHLTYRNMFSLSETATSNAIRQRVLGGAGQADPDTLRGFLLRRPPGCCLWVRTGAFHLIGGMDERYEGWGGEDNDFVYRMDFNAAFDSYDDWLLHMAHPPSSLLMEDGELVNAHIPGLSWRPDGPIGRIDRFAVAEASGTPA